MKLKDTGLTKEQLIEKANKYLIDTAARFDFIETAGQPPGGFLM